MKRLLVLVLAVALTTLSLSVLSQSSASADPPGTSISVSISTTTAVVGGTGPIATAVLSSQGHGVDNATLLVVVTHPNGSQTVQSVITDATGTGVVTLTGLTKGGAYSVVAAFLGNDSIGQLTSDSRAFTVYQPTALTVTNGAEPHATVPVQIVATLKTSPSGSPITGQTVSFSTGSQSLGSAVTNSIGQATIQFTPPAVDTYVITAQFDGIASDFTDSLGTLPPVGDVATTQFSATTAPTSVVVNVNPAGPFIVGGTPPRAVGSLTGPIEAIAAPVTLRLTDPAGDTTVLNVETDSTNGEFSQNLVGPVRGSYSVTANYAGDTLHQPSSSHPVGFSEYERTLLAVSAPSTGQIGQPVTITAHLTSVLTAAVLSGASGLSVAFAVVGGPSLGTAAVDSAGIATTTFVPTEGKTYAISATFSDPADFFTDHLGTLPAAPEVGTATVTGTGVPVSVTVTGGQTYGGAASFTVPNPLPSGVTATGPITCSTVDGGTAIAAGLAAKSYTIDASSCTGLSADASVVLTVVGGAFVVTPAALKITASSASMTYGGSVPAITAAFAGFVNGEAQSALTTPPTCTTVATPTSPFGGSYATSCSGAIDGNYTITYVPGAVSVTQAPLTITASSPAMTVGGPVPTITASYAGFVNAQGPSNLTTLPTCTTTATATSPVGSYASTCAGAVDGNYAISYVAGTVTVAKAATILIANPVKIGLLTLTFSAALTRTADHAPLAGRTIVFSVGSRTTCTATTNTKGVASCTTFGLVITLGGHPTYTARFAGDASDFASTGSARL